MRAAAARALGVAAVIAASACGGGQAHVRLFSTDWEDDGGASIESVRQRIGTNNAPVAADVAIGVAGNSDKLVGIPLGGGTKWTFAHAIEDRPVVAGQVVVAQGGGELFALDAKTGQKLWARPSSGLFIRGAADDGKYTVVTLAATGGTGCTLLAVDRQGGVAQKVETDKSLGAPAVVKGVALVPWNHQYITAYDLDTGNEIGRVLVRGKVSQMLAVGGALYFGEVELFRFDEQTKLASKGGATRIVIPQRELPASPALMRSVDQRVGPAATAVDKTRIYVRPAAGAAELDASRFYANYFRLTMGFESTKGTLAWVHSHPVDVIGAAAGASSLVICDEAGKVTSLDAATGAPTGDLTLGEPLKSCVVSADGLAAKPPTNAAAPLVAQLSSAVRSNDPEMVTGQRLLLRELSVQQDESATATLVELASDPRTAPLLVSDARAALAARRNGARAMTEALGRRYDYLRDVLRAPPVGPIAQALAAMKEKAAAPALAAHLFDTSDTDDDIKQATAALAVLGDASLVPALTEFLNLYRASAPTDELAQAVVNAGQALLAFGGDGGRKAVDAALADSMTLPIVKSRLGAIVQSVDAEKSLARDKAKAGDKGKK